MGWVAVGYNKLKQCMYWLYWMIRQSWNCWESVVMFSMHVLIVKDWVWCSCGGDYSTYQLVLYCDLLLTSYAPFSQNQYIPTLIHHLLYTTLPIRWESQHSYTSLIYGRINLINNHAVEFYTGYVFQHLPMVDVKNNRSHGLPTLP